MKGVLVRSRDLLVLRGVLALLFGVSVLLSIGMTLPTLAFLFGTYVLFDGIAAIAFGVRHTAHEHTWLIVLKGFAGIGLGVAVLTRLRATDRPLVMAIGFWALLTGLLEVVVAMRLHPEVPDETLIGAAGVISVVLGIAILILSPTSALALALLLGCFGVLFGVSLLAQAAMLGSPTTGAVDAPPRRSRQGDG